MLCLCQEHVELEAETSGDAEGASGGRESKPHRLERHLQQGPGGVLGRLQPAGVRDAATALPWRWCLQPAAGVPRGQGTVLPRGEVGSARCPRSDGCGPFLEVLWLAQGVAVQHSKAS